MFMNMITQARQSSFLRHNAVFFFGSLAVGVMNYAYYPIVGRMMDPAAFGELQVLVSLFLQFTIFLNVLGMITINIVANYKNMAGAHRVIFEIEKVAAYVTFVILLVSIAFGEFFRQQLRFDSTLPFVALALALLISIPLTFRSSYIRAEKRFGVASVTQLIGAFTKLIGSVVLVALGMGVVGAMVGIVGAQFVAFLYAARWAARVGFKRPSDTHYGTPPDLKAIMPEIKYASAVFVGLLSVTMMMSIDVIAVKYYFDATTAGLYAGIATVARILFFVAAPISQVLMPLVKTSQSARENMLLLGKSLALTTGVCGVILIWCIVAPEAIIRLLMGQAYVAYANLLPMLAIVVFIISVVNLVFMYYLVLRRTMIMLIGIMDFVVLISLLLWRHDTLHAVVYSLLLGSIFTLLTTGVYVLANLRRGTRDAKQNDLDRYSDLQ